MFKNFMNLNFDKIESTGTKVSFGITSDEKLVHLFSIDANQFQLLCIVKMNPFTSEVWIAIKFKDIKQNKVNIASCSKLDMSDFLKQRTSIFQKLIFSAKRSFGPLKWVDLDCLGKTESEIFNWCNKNLQYFKIVKTIMFF